MKYLFGNFNNKTMRQQITAMIFILSLISCKPGYEVTYKKQMKEAYINDFKLIYFTKLFDVGFDYPKEIMEKFKKDGSGYSEPLLSGEDIQLINQFVKIDNQQMISDSIQRIGTVAEGAQGKNVLSFLLTKYNSKWLDRLAKTRYKIYKKRENNK